jgi:transposase
MDLTDDERRSLEAVVAAPTSEQRAAIRARIVLLADKGTSTEKIADSVGVSPRVVVKWRSRFARHRASGLVDAAGRGRPRKHGSDVRLKIATEACRPPEGSSQWSTRDLGAHLGVPHVLVHRVLKAESIKPHLQEMWLNSQDPEFERKQAEIVGLYLDPPENALVICVDEKTGMQALGRKYPDKPVKAGSPAKREFEYVRYGTQSLLAALCVSDGSVSGKCYDRHTHEEFLDFLKEIVERHPVGELHLIVDNLSVHKHHKVTQWLGSNERVHFHFTPTHASWMNQIEIWFSILGRKLLKRGIFASKEDLVQQVMAFIERHNQTAKPFRWTYTGDPLVA